MNHEHPQPTTPSETPGYARKRDPHILDFVSVLAKHKRTVIVVTFLCAALSIGISFVMPFTYEGIATLIPPEKQSSGSQLLSFLSGSSALDMMKGAENPALDMFKNVIDSRTVSEEVAKDSAMYKYFSTFDTSVDAIAGSIRDCLTSEALRNGMFNVQVDVKTHWLPSSAEKEQARHLVPKLARLYVNQLDRYNRERLMTSARNTRIFTENEYNARLRSLDTAYARLQAFQEQNKAVALTEQLSAAVTGAALLSSQQQQLQIELGAAEHDLSPDATRVQLLRQRLDETTRELKKYDDGGVGEYVLALKDVPELARQLAKLMREVKMLETVSAFLRQQLEQERINEQRDLPTFTVLDSATLPQRKASPKRSIMLLLGTFVGVVLSIITVSWMKFREDVTSNPEDHQRYLTMIGYLRGRKA